MSKIICDICGTTYPDTAQCCPICGCSRDDAASLLGDEVLSEEIADESKGRGRFTSKKHKEIFDYDEVNTPKSQPAPRAEEPGEDPYEEGPKHNTGAVIALTALIAVLLLAACFLFVKFFLPNILGGDEDVSTEPPAITTEATQGESVPCQNLVLISGEAKLLSPGANHLINVFAQPDNTTDQITFRSSDESVVTVDENGMVTAVGQGTAEIHILCGDQEEIAPVTVSFEEQTEPSTEPEATGATDGAAETQPSGDGAEETTAATTAPASDVKLKLKKTDIKLGVYYEFQLLLDCKLEQNAVQWSSEHPNIVSVDAEGNIKALRKGTTSVTAKYGDQEVSCIVRCV